MFEERMCFLRQCPVVRTSHIGAFEYQSIKLTIAFIFIIPSDVERGTSFIDNFYELRISKIQIFETFEKAKKPEEMSGSKLAFKWKTTVYSAQNKTMIIFL